MSTNTNLLFTRNSTSRTVLVDESTGRPLYKLETPRGVFRETTRIRKFAPTDDIDIERLLASGCEDSEGSADIKEEKLEGDPDEIEIESDKTGGWIDSNEVARIHWSHLKLAPDRVVFRGQISDKRKLIEKSGT